MITVFTSAQANPQSSQSDLSVNQEDLPQSSLQFYADATDSSDPSATFTFSWSILQKPTGSSASFVNANVQNPVLDNVDTWGNYRLFCIATSSAGGTSQSDPILAPNTSFVSVRVLSENRDLQKMSAGERDWHTYAHEWVQSIEDMSVSTLNDVQLGTLSNGEVLKYNGTNWYNGSDAGGTLTINDASNDEAVLLDTQKVQVKSTDSNIEFTVGTDSGDPNIKFIDATIASNLTLHGKFLTLNNSNNQASSSITFKRGDSDNPLIAYDEPTSTFVLQRDNATGPQVIMTQDDVPTTSVRGGVLLPSGFNTNTTAKILDKERLIYSGSADLSISATGTANANPTNAIIVIGQNSGSPSDGQHCHVLFQNTTGSAINIADIRVIMLDGGVFSSVDYSFKLNIYTSLNNMTANTTDASSFTLGSFVRGTTGRTGVSAWNYVLSNSGNLVSVADGHYFGVEVLTEADTHPGHGMRVEIETYRDIAS